MLFCSDLRSLGSGSQGPSPGLGLFSLFPESRVPSPESRVPFPESRVPSPESRVPSPVSRLSSIHCPRMRPRKRAPLLPIVGSLIRPMLAMRSSAMRSAAL